MWSTVCVCVCVRAKRPWLGRGYKRMDRSGRGGGAYLIIV